MTQKTFLGIEIEGDITYAERRAVQRPVEEFGPVLQAVLDDEHFAELGWTQYTPYFNDGDPCVFSASGIWLRTTGDGVHSEDDEDYDDDGSEYYDVAHGSGVIGAARGEYDHAIRAYVPPSDLEPWIYALRQKALTLDDAVVGGEFDDVLLGAFGDHAEVTVRRDGIHVEFIHALR